MASPIRRLHSWYTRIERPVSSLSLLGGFIFDIFTLKRVDLPLENLWILAHLLVAAMGIIVLNIYEVRKLRKDKAVSKKEKEEDIKEDMIRFWLIFIIQFAFGGLFSTFLVFYFRSATLAASWPFMTLLALVFIFNEVFKKHYLRLTFQISVLFIATFSFAIYVVPVIVHEISDKVFILSGISSLVVIWIFIRLVAWTSEEKFRKGRVILLSSILGLFTVINILYFYNLIPPIPLSLKDADVLHSFSKNAQENYDIVYEQRGFGQRTIDFFRSYETYHQIPGEPVYVYTAIFSPTNLNVDIVHEWQYFDASSTKWVTSAEIPLRVIGGRDAGFRTYSSRYDLAEGLWRINIKTLHDKLIGQIKFDVVDVTKNVSLESGVR